MMARAPFLEEFGYGGKESYGIAMEFQRMLEHALHRAFVTKKRNKRRLPTKSAQ
jgi:hypothetical protein